MPLASPSQRHDGVSRGHDQWTRLFCWSDLCCRAFKSSSHTAFHMMAPGLTTYALPVIQSLIKIKLTVTGHQIGKWVTDWYSKAVSCQSKIEWPHLIVKCHWVLGVLFFSSRKRHILQSIHFKEYVNYFEIFSNCYFETFCNYNITDLGSRWGLIIRKKDYYNHGFIVGWSQMISYLISYLCWMDRHN